MRDLRAERAAEAVAAPDDQDEGWATMPEPKKSRAEGHSSNAAHGDPIVAARPRAASEVEPEAKRRREDEVDALGSSCVCVQALW